jgi:hypothetical protein
LARLLRSAPIPIQAKTELDGLPDRNNCFFLTPRVTSCDAPKCLQLGAKRKCLARVKHDASEPPISRGPNWPNPVASVSLSRGPTTIRTENGQLVTYIFVDIRDRDLGGYVAEAQKAVAASVQFPPGYYVTWSGQFEYLERAEARLKMVVPVTLLIIFLPLYLNFRALTETLIVMLSLPFSLVGGLWLFVVARFQPLGRCRRGIHRAGRRRRQDRRRNADLSRTRDGRAKAD